MSKLNKYYVEVIGLREKLIKAHYYTIEDGFIIFRHERTELIYTPYNHGKIISMYPVTRTIIRPIYD